MSSSSGRHPSGPSRLHWEACWAASSTQVHAHTYAHVLILEAILPLLTRDTLQHSLFYFCLFQFIPLNKGMLLCLTKLVSCSTNELQLQFQKHWSVLFFILFSFVVLIIIIIGSPVKFVVSFVGDIRIKLPPLLNCNPH